MLVLLFLCSIICIAAGAAMIAFGIPVKEFSFGDTLISGGITAAVGGLILAGIGFAIVHLQRVMDALAVRPAVPGGHLAEPFEPRAGARASRTPFAASTRSERRPPDGPTPEIESPATGAASADEHAARSSAPTLRNPDETPVASDGIGTPLSPQRVSGPPLVNHARERATGTQPMSAAAPADAGTAAHTERREDGRARAPDWRATTPPGRQPQSTFFDTMWPSHKRLPQAAMGEEASGVPAEPARSTEPADAAHPVESESAHAAAPGERRTVAILKSGVVDGMAYTLYVDGSIEAELPDGKLRFASINELRSYLEKHS